MIHVVHSWNRTHHRIVIHIWDCHVEILSSINLKDFLQLQFIVFQLGLRIHHIVFILAYLCLELLQIHFGKTSHFHHRLSTISLNLCGFEYLFAYFHSLVLIQNLHVILRNLFLDGISSLFCVEFGDFCGELTLFHIFLIPSTVPNSPARIQSITAIVVQFIAGRSERTAIQIHKRLRERTPRSILIRGSRQTGQQCRLGLQFALFVCLSSDKVLLQLDIVRQSIVQAFLESPFFRCRRPSILSQRWLRQHGKGERQ